MPATALLKFEIDAVDGPDGQVAELAFSDLPKDVVVKNSDNTGVGSWQLDLVYSPPGATTPATTALAFSDDGLSALNLTLPINLPGSWRLVFKVWSGANRTGAPTDVDIRNVMAKTSVGFHIPPPQVFPLPLPSLSSGLPGAKPNEANLGGREDLGWAGNDSDGLLNDFLRNFAPAASGVGYAIMFVYATFGYTPSDSPDGSPAKPYTTFTQAHAALPPEGGVIYVVASDGSSDASGLAFTKPVAVIADSPQQWGSGTHSVTSTAALYVENMTVTTDEGGQPGILSAAGLTCKKCTAQFQSTAGFDLDDCVAQGGSLMHATGAARLRDCNVATSLGAGGTLELHNCVITGNLSSNDVLARFTTCRWTVGTRTVTFTGSAGVMEVDDYSNARWKAAVETLTNGTLSVISQATADAAAAQSTANTALANAATAQSTANTALANAATAQTAADHNPFMEADLAKGSNFTLALTDLYKKLRLTAALTITVPLNATVALPVGIRIPLLADVAGLAQVTVAPFSGAVTVKKATSLALTLREQGSPAELWQQATDVWWLLGDLTVSP